MRNFNQANMIDRLNDGVQFDCIIDGMAAVRAKALLVLHLCKALALCPATHAAVPATAGGYLPGTGSTATERNSSVSRWSRGRRRGISPQG